MVQGGTFSEYDVEESLGHPVLLLRKRICGLSMLKSSNLEISLTSAVVAVYPLSSFGLVEFHYEILLSTHLQHLIPCRVGKLQTIRGYHVAPVSIDNSLLQNAY